MWIKIKIHLFYPRCRSKSKSIYQYPRCGSKSQSIYFLSQMWIRVTIHLSISQIWIRVIIHLFLFQMWIKVTIHLFLSLACISPDLIPCCPNGCHFKRTISSADLCCAQTESPGFHLVLLFWKGYNATYFLTWCGIEVWGGEDRTNDHYQVHLSIKNVLTSSLQVELGNLWIQNVCDSEKLIGFCLAVFSGDVDHGYENKRKCVVLQVTIYNMSEWHSSHKVQCLWLQVGWPMCGRCEDG